MAKSPEPSGVALVSKRRTLVGVALLLSVAAFFLMRTNEPPGYSSIVNGMTADEVHVALKAEPTFANTTKEGPIERFSLAYGTVEISYSRAGQLTEKSFQPSLDTLGRLKAWLDIILHGPAPSTKPRRATGLSEGV